MYHTVKYSSSFIIITFYPNYLGRPPLSSSSISIIRILFTHFSYPRVILWNPNPPVFSSIFPSRSSTYTFPTTLTASASFLLKTRTGHPNVFRRILSILGATPFLLFSNSFILVLSSLVTPLVNTLFSRYMSICWPTLRTVRHCGS